MNKSEQTDLEYIAHIVRGELVKISNNVPHLAFGHCGPDNRQ